MNAHDIRNAVNSYLPFPVSDAEIQEFIEIADQSRKAGQVSKTDFMNFIN